MGKIASKLVKLVEVKFLVTIFSGKVNPLLHNTYLRSIQKLDTYIFFHNMSNSYTKVKFDQIYPAFILTVNTNTSQPYTINIKGQHISHLMT